MALPLIFSKVKTLAPVAVVAGAVAVTIKLLTQESTPTSQFLQVKAEEDILNPEFEEEIEEPQPEPAPPEPEQEEVADAEADDESSEQEGNSESESEPKENQEQAQQDEKDEKKPEARSIKPSEISDVLTALLKD